MKKPERPGAVGVRMRGENDRDLTILNAIAENDRVTQRHLARELGVAVSLANLYVRRLALKGLVRVINIRPNRLRYILTPKGIVEKSHLTYSYMCRTLDRYREARQALLGALRPLGETGYKRIAFYGTGEAAEVAYLCLRELGLDLGAVFEGKDGKRFLGLPVRRLEELVPAEFDRIVVTSFTSQEATEDMIQELLQRGIARDQIVTLHR